MHIIIVLLSGYNYSMCTCVLTRLISIRHLLTVGVYHKYDTVALPEDANISRNWLTGKFTTFKSLFGFHGTRDLRRPSDTELRQLCLQFYLELNRYQDILSLVQFEDTSAMSGYIEKIEHLFNSMCVVSTLNYGEPRNKESVTVHSIDRELTKVYRITRCSAC